ncbi:O-methyltransferase-like protein [Candidatus Hydrogenisulfobacillus filiaventi]|uniref:O-methyltransferase-like protein n=1 Tax=Candidatus Hydrogenisulfobacillus filiaventi TaxID=2707344 RepID=A0A6F8ZD14_9FIRM|nr:class I SAM-dependent methyltransferase [Bacillota bacterium]CAB1127821.1 O-methyltransferase-like protein [Candidatus Hydrogenisulfobacillus filiaventi]
MSTQLPVMVQKPSEFQRLLDILRDLRPQSLLEIGVFQGGSLARFATAAAPRALILGIDLAPPPTVPHGPLQRLQLIAGNARDAFVRAQVVDILDGHQLDFLFIDGDHRAALQDFAEYGPLVHPGGIIAFHDIVPGPPSDVGTVPQDWQALKRGRPHLELVENWGQGGYGIGVIWQT